jgi:hypothetical protein
MLGEVAEQARHNRGRCRRKRDEPHAPGPQPAQLGELAGRGIQRRRHRRCVPSQHATASVRRTLRPTRSITGTPSRCSSRFSCWLSAGWLYPSDAAAAVIEPSSRSP